MRALLDNDCIPERFHQQSVAAGLLEGCKLDKKSLSGLLRLLKVLGWG